MPLHGKVAIVTGGAQGIGKAIAKKFLKKGCITVIADNDWEAGEETAEEYRNIGRIEFIPVDVSSEKEIRELVEKTIIRYLPLISISFLTTLSSNAESCSGNKSIPINDLVNEYKRSKNQLTKFILPS